MSARACWWLALLVVGCARAPAPSSPAPRDRAQHSNVLFADYVGSDACAGCHPSEAEAFQRSPMHRMTRALPNTEVQAPFANETFTLRGDHARLFQDAGERRLELTTSGGSSTLFRVTKVIGGRYREDFVGIELDPKKTDVTVGEERILPVSYLVFDRSYRYKGYSVLVTERPRLEPGQTWRQTCVFCHNTPPAFSALFDELHGPGAPGYQGSASDETPADRRFRYEVTDREALDRSLADELTRIGASPRELTGRAALRDAIEQTRQTFAERQLVELGIGCEACHGGGREHVAAPYRVKPSFLPQSSFFELRNADGSELTPALAINRTCAKCHTVLFSRYPYTWEGGNRRHDPQGSPINSGEARDFLLGGCRNQLACTRCHDPHAEDAKSALDALAGPKGDQLCTSCHESLASAIAARAHSHHAPDSDGNHCLNCHMPRKNMGLAYKLGRYHRIGSPNDPARVEHDRPLECALCHADKSVDQIVSTMERWWPKRFDRNRLERLYGADLRINAVRATLFAGLPHEQAIAATIAAERDQKQMLPLILNVLKNEYPLVRYYAKHAAEQLTGSPLPINPEWSRAEIEKALESQP